MRRSQNRTLAVEAVKDKDGLGLWPGVGSIPCGPPASTCGHGNHACVCAADCSAETFFSCLGDLELEKFEEKQPDGLALASRQLYARTPELSIVDAALGAVDNRGRLVLDWRLLTAQHP